MSKKFFLISLLLFAILYLANYFSKLLHLEINPYIDVLMNIDIFVVVVSYVIFKWNSK